VDWTQTVSLVAAVGAITIGVVGAQAFWIARALDALRDEMHRGFELVELRFERVDQRFERVEQRLDRIEGSVLRDHGERIARLEAQG
jgi:uncharacterized membrane-anchored protein